MNATLEDVTKKPKPTAEELTAEEMVRRTREQCLSLTGPDGLLKQLTKTVLGTALNQEMTEHLGHEKPGRPVPGSGNVRNGTRGQDGADRGTLISRAVRPASVKAGAARASHRAAIATPGSCLQ